MFSLAILETEGEGARMRAANLYTGHEYHLCMAEGSLWSVFTNLVWCMCSACLHPRQENTPQILIGASSSSKIGCDMKTSRAAVQIYLISASVSWTFHRRDQEVGRGGGNRVSRARERQAGNTGGLAGLACCAYLLAGARPTHLQKLLQNGINVTSS